MVWVCEGCEQENEDSDAVCCACEEPKPHASADAQAGGGFVVGLILEASPIAGKDKLTKLSIEIGAGSGPVVVVSNAPHLEQGQHVVVARVGSTVNADGDEVVVSKAVVGGVTSSGDHERSQAYRDLYY